MKGELERRLYYLGCGGSWVFSAGSARAACRFSNGPSYRDGLLSLRLMRRCL